jgi:5-methylcytosine-specific restriction endonuclease McrA
VALQSRANIANTAARIFLQDFGAAYDDARGLPRYAKSKHFSEVRAFFGERCCYCGADFGPQTRAVEDHLVPLNRKDLGLHAWGNIVASCAQCNELKLGRPWHQVVAERAGENAAERYKLIDAFVKHYKYDPPYDLANATADLYAEVCTRR